MGEVFRALARRFFVLFLAAVVAFVLVLLVADLSRAKPTVASWYGPGFEGLTTSNGEKFDSKEYTAAHRKLPFGTKLLVTYGERSVVVRINDRGPFSEADLDLSRAAAKHLRMIRVGVAEVEMATVDPDTPVGPYKEEADAEAPPKDTEKNRDEPEAASSGEQKETRDEPEAAEPEAAESQAPRDDGEETRPDGEPDSRKAPRDVAEAAPPTSVESAPQDTPEEAVPPTTEEDGSSTDEEAAANETREDEEAAANEAREDQGSDRRDEETPAARSDGEESSAADDKERRSSRQDEDVVADDDEDRRGAEASEGSREEEALEEAEEEAPPPPQRIVVAPEPELVVPGSTVERRLELAAVAEEDQGAQLESLALSEASASEETTAAKGSGSSGKGPNGITRLPDTGGAPVSGPTLLLVGAALGLLLLRTGR